MKKRCGDESPLCRPGRTLSGDCRGSASLYILFIIFVVLAGCLFYFRLQEEPRRPLRAVNKPPVAPPSASASGAPAPSVDIKIHLSEPVAVQHKSALAEAYKSFDSGKDDEGLDLVRAAMKDFPDSAEIKEYYAEALNYVAARKSSQGRIAEAREFLTEAASISKNVATILSIADTQIRLNDFKGAASTLEPFHENDSSVKDQLIYVYERIVTDAHNAGRVDEVTQYYEKLLQIKGGGQSEQEALAGLKSEAEAEGRMSKTDGSHFTVKYDGGENAVTGHVIGLLLEEAYHKVGSDFNYYPDDRIEALLYFKERFRDVTGAPSWAGALYDGRIKVPAGGVTEKSKLLEEVLFHEYTHAVVFRLSGGRAPKWLNEGLAQIEQEQDDAEYTGQLKRLADYIKERRFEGNILRRLEGSFVGMSSEEAGWAYLLSLSATKYLVREFGIFSGRKILENLKEGKSMDDAVYGALSMSYDDFYGGWLDSLRNH